MTTEFFFRTRAKALLLAFKAGDETAIARVRAVLGDGPVSLMRVQHVVAVQVGFAKWADLINAPESELLAAVEKAKALDAEVAVPPEQPESAPLGDGDDESWFPSGVTANTSGLSDALRGLRHALDPMGAMAEGIRASSHGIQRAVDPTGPMAEGIRASTRGIQQAIDPIGAWKEQMRGIRQAIDPIGAWKEHTRGIRQAADPIGAWKEHMRGIRQAADPIGVMKAEMRASMVGIRQAADPIGVMKEEMRTAMRGIRQAADPIGVMKEEMRTAMSGIRQAIFPTEAGGWSDASEGGGDDDA